VRHRLPSNLLLVGYDRNLWIGQLVEGAHRTFLAEQTSEHRRWRAGEEDDADVEGSGPMGRAATSTAFGMAEIVAEGARRMLAAALRNGHPEPRTITTRMLPTWSSRPVTNTRADTSGNGFWVS
jgi:hypothetical protein